MKEIKDFDYGFIKDEMVRLRDKSFKTNFFLNEHKFSQIAKGIQYRLFQTESGCYIFIQDNQFERLYFLVRNRQELEENLGVVMNYAKDIVTTELVGNTQYLAEIENAFENSGFYQYTSLMRMSKSRNEEIGCPPNSEFISQLGMEKEEELLKLFHDFFDKFAEQIPTKQELEELIEKENVYYFSDNGAIQGFIIFEINGFTSHLRYWFVHPKYREKRIGSLLINLFFTKGKSVRRELFWVIKSNQNAIKRYKHYGFNEENMFNKVLINKNLKYEK